MRPGSLARQRQASGVYQVLLDMEQVGGMMGAERLFGMGDQGLGLVAGDLADRHRPAGQPLVQALSPGRGVALGGVLFQQQEIGDRLDGHQADLGMKGFVFAEADFAGRHLGGQPLVFLPAVAPAGSRPRRLCLM